MAVEDVRKTLENEIELLDHMINCAQQFEGGHFTKKAQYIQKSWIRFLGDRLASNKQLMGLGRDELRADLRAERDQVVRYEYFTDVPADYTETWHKFIVCEKEILEHLRSQ